MGSKSRFDCQDRDENRVSTQIFGLLINQAPTDGSDSDGLASTVSTEAMSNVVSG